MKIFTTIQNDTMRPGFYLRCSVNWLAVTEGFGCDWPHQADPDRASCYETLEDAHAVFQRLIVKRGWGAHLEIVQVVPVLPCPRCGEEPRLTQYKNMMWFECCNVAGRVSSDRTMALETWSDELAALPEIDAERNARVAARELMDEMLGGY